VEKWIRELPISRVAYPSSLADRLKFWFWKVYSPFHPFVRDASFHIGIGKFLMHRVVPETKASGRQDFLLGMLNPAYSVQELVSFLIKQGFGNHFVAWKDADEVVSLRRTVDFKHQYHLRIFADGEVRCHFEYTPEYHPFLHLVRVGFEDRTSEFKELLQEWIIAPSTSGKANS